MASKHLSIQKEKNRYSDYGMIYKKAILGVALVFSYWLSGFSASGAGHSTLCSIYTDTFSHCNNL